jgi:predicted DCC family thiol-disulfide oxidoreductase YuxK
MPSATFAPLPTEAAPDGLILFDGVCVFCSRWVRFVIERDTAEAFICLPIQSEDGRGLAARFAIDPDAPQTNAAIIDGVAYFKSDAALMVLARLPGWRWVKAGWLCPTLVRDFVYDRIAKNRYRIFGRYDSCIVPGPEFRSRVLDRLPP